MKIKKYVVAAALSFFYAANLMAVELAKWDKKPIPIRLSAGSERIIYFPDNVSVGAPVSVMEKLRVQSNGGAIFLLASEEIAETRLQVKMHGTGQVLLLDVWADKTEEPITEDVKVIVDDGKKNQEKDSPQQEQPASPENMVSPVTLIRYVAQRYYSPRRLWVDHPGINQTSVRLEGNLDFFIKNEKFGLVDVTPDAAWTGGGYYITAFRLKNKSLRPVTLNFTDINAQYEYATFQHFSMERKGLPGDTTMLYVVTANPIEHSLYPWMPKPPPAVAEKG
ncbi:TIGR03749 family integrating conjugative element protein [Endozoicomonas sp. ALC066]|uniref:TIGR03749 family integrating conjugative element protein n=1 Tax=Endozoicomonas sp. ALC066 TaxID=3403078 RepID=UPI003BB60625